jgi:hypothetical protein
LALVPEAGQQHIRDPEPAALNRRIIEAALPGNLVADNANQNKRKELDSRNYGSIESMGADCGVNC